jgi:hypothetical protein
MFALATGELEGADSRRSARWPPEVVAEAILRAVRAAESIEGIPALVDMPRYDDVPDAPR